MEQRDIKLEVKALWLQYTGMQVAAEMPGGWSENAARSDRMLVPAAELPEGTGLLMAA